MCGLLRCAPRVHAVWNSSPHVGFETHRLFSRLKIWFAVGMLLAFARTRRTYRQENTVCLVKPYRLYSCTTGTGTGAGPSSSYGFMWDAHALIAPWPWGARRADRAWRGSDPPSKWAARRQSAAILSPCLDSRLLLRRDNALRVPPLPAMRRPDRRLSMGNTRRSQQARLHHTADLDRAVRPRVRARPHSPPPSALAVAAAWARPRPSLEPSATLPPL